MADAAAHAMPMDHDTTFEHVGHSAVISEQPGYPITSNTAGEAQEGVQQSCEHFLGAHWKAPVGRKQAGYR